MLRTTEAAGMCTAANDNDDDDLAPAKGIGLAVLIGLAMWLGFGAFLLGVLAS
jgi:hypothetical protein